MKQIRFQQPSPKSVVDLPTYDGEGRNYWRKIKNVYTSVRLFQQPLTKSISSPDEVTFGGLEQRHQICIQTSPSEVAKLRANDDFNDALKQIKKERELFFYVERGSSLDSISQILHSDPTKYLYEPQHPFRLVNKKNANGLTPLYIAAKNGFVDVCKLLIENGADQNISVKVNQIDDYPLAVALRWRHQQVIELLISQNPNKIVKNICAPLLDKQLKQKYFN